MCIIDIPTPEEQGSIKAKHMGENSKNIKVREKRTKAQISLCRSTYFFILINTWYIKGFQLLTISF
jgi:hypothetical protein